jgi:hypothetical protein
VADVPLPPGVCTVMVATSSAAAGGVLQVIEVSLTTTTLVAGWPANRTEVAPVKPVPVMVTEVLPAGGPEVGATLLTTGAASSSGSPITAPTACELETAARASALLAARLVCPTAAAGTVAMPVVTTAAADMAAADTVAVVPAKDRRLSRYRARGSRSRTARACVVWESRYRRTSACAASASKPDHSIANQE